MCVGLQVTGSQDPSDRGEEAARLQVLLWLPVSRLRGRFHVVHLAEGMAFFFQTHMLCTHASFLVTSLLSRESFRRTALFKNQ